MQVSDVMTPEVACVRPKDTLLFAAEKMRDLDIGSLPVCNDQHRLVGVISDRDITIRGTASALDPILSTVDLVMTPEVITCYEDQDVEDVARTMEANQIRRIVVLNHEDHLVGIVSLGDLAVKLGDDLMSGEILEQISEPTASL